MKCLFILLVMIFLINFFLWTLYLRNKIAKFAFNCSLYCCLKEIIPWINSIFLNVLSSREFKCHGRKHRLYLALMRTWTSVKLLWTVFGFWGQSPAVWWSHFLLQDSKCFSSAHSVLSVTANLGLLVSPGQGSSPGSCFLFTQVSLERML